MIAVRGGRSEVVQEGFGGQMAGNLACGCTAHAVAHDEGSSLGADSEGILVAAADKARVRQHRVDEWF